jgi:hypothetical protein
VKPPPFRRRHSERRDRFRNTTHDALPEACQSRSAGRASPKSRGTNGVAPLSIRSLTSRAHRPRSLSLRGPRSGPKQSHNAGRACPKSRTETGRRRATSLFFAPQCHRERKALEACHCEAREAGRSNLVTRAEPVRSRALKRQRGLRPAPSRAGHSGTPDANRAGVGVLWPFLPCDAIGILVSAVMP